MDQILEVEEVTKAFGGLKAVENLSLAFPRGKITSLIGPNGAGKTTLFNLISGFLKPDTGEIRYRGRRIDGLSPGVIARLEIGRLFQDVRVFSRMTVLDNLLVAKKEHPGENPLNVLFARRKVFEAERGALAEAEKWLEFVGLARSKEQLAETLSYGQQKLLAIARLLAGGFDLLLLDEPTAGVSPTMVKAILETIRRLVDQGKTVILVEHNMTVVLEISDWVYFMDEGKMVSFGLPEEVLGDPQVRAAYLGV